MPFVKITLQENTESITRPIVMDIVNQVKSIVKIPDSVQIIFPGDTGKMQQQGSAIDNTSRQTQLQSQRYVYIEVEELDDPQYGMSTAVNFPEYNPVFNDPKNFVQIGPLYSTSNVTIRFKYQAPSRTELKRWVDDIRMRISGMRDVNLHKIDYHFLMPDQYMLLLQAVYANLQQLSPTNQTFAQYVASNISTRAKLITDLVGQDIRLSIAETQMRIIGRYDFDAFPDKPEREEDNAVWTGSFSYKFTYERPTMMTARYPIMVANSLLPQEYIAFWNTNYNDLNVNRAYSYSIGSLSQFEVQNEPARYIDFNYEYRLPYYDDFNPQTTPTSAVGIFNALCEVDPADQQSLLNLNQLGDIILDEDILSFIVSSEYPFITNLYQSIFYLSFYTNYTLQSSGNLTCDAALNIKATAPLNLNNFHHVRLTIITDLSLVNVAFYQRLRYYPKALVKIVTAVNEGLRNNPVLQSIAELPYVNDADFSVLFANLLGLRNVGKNNLANYNPIDPFGSIRGPALELYRNNATRFNTVMRSNIIAKRHTN